MRPLFIFLFVFLFSIFSSGCSLYGKSSGKAETLSELNVSDRLDRLQLDGYCQVHAFGEEVDNRRGQHKVKIICK